LDHEILPAPDFRQRRKRALDGNHHGDALILCDPLDIQYLTGSHHGISWLVVQEHSSFAVSRHMLVSEVRAEAVDCDILLASASSTERPELEQFVVAELVRRGIDTVVIDPARLSAQSYLRLTRHAADSGIRLKDHPEILAGVRAVKDPAEITLTRQCVRIAEQAFTELLAKGAASLIGRTERDLANELETRMWALGATRQGFPETGIIVASGPNSAKPHHTPGQRRISAGEALLIDWGAEISGYRSDLTRTVFPGSVPDFALQAYPVVEQALQRAAGRLRAGAAMGEIDRAARETITDAGYTEFHYGVGHGVGLAIHEAPWLRAGSTEPCEDGMLTTIEPGIYLPGIGGIRIENLYQVTRGGCECLGKLPVDLESMVLP
jgi:Xaa-Pro aminopeptidase